MYGKATVINSKFAVKQAYGSFVDTGRPKVQTVIFKAPYKIENIRNEDIEAGDSYINKPKDFGENVLSRDLQDTSNKNRMKMNVMDSATRKIEVKTKTGHDKVRTVQLSF